MTVYMAVSLPEFKPFESNLALLKGLVLACEVLDLEQAPDDKFEGPECINDVLGTRLTTIGQPSNGLLLLYGRGMHSDTFTLVLQVHNTALAWCHGVSSLLDVASCGYMLCGKYAAQPFMLFAVVDLPCCCFLSHQAH